MEESSTFSLKELLVLIPVFSSALAILFDVGYFYGLGALNFFSIFSTTEHITFALQAFPLALFLALSFSAGMLIGRIAGNMAEGKARSEQKKPSDASPRWLRYLMILMPVTAMLAGAIVLKTATPAVISVFFLVALILIWRLPRDRTRPPIFVAYATVVCCVLAFSLGFDSASRYKAWGKFLSMIKTDKDELRAKILRSGDRGLLYQDGGTKQLHLLPWSEVKKIVSVVD